MFSFVPVFQKFPDIEIKLNSINNRKLHVEKESGIKYCIFSNDDDIAGEISIVLKEESKFDHIGITIELIGKITTKNNDHDSEFLNLSKELEAPGVLEKSTKYYFSFKKVNMPYESYSGENIILKYFVKVTLTKKLIATKSYTEKEFLVYNPSYINKLNACLRIEIGILNKLNLELEIFQNKFHLNDCILGKILFNKVTLGIKSIEAHLYKKEVLLNENKNLEVILISKFEIVDGQPFNGDIVPLRLFIGSFNLSPTFKDVNSFFSVKYFLKLIIIDNDDRAFCKEQEIFLYRKKL